MAKSKKTFSFSDILNGEEVKKGILEVPAEQFNDYLQTECGLNVEDLQRGQEAKSKWLLETTRHAGPMVADYFKENPEESTVTMTAHCGYDQQHTIFTRGEDTVEPVRHVIETYGTDNVGELREVHKATMELFKDL